MTVSPEKIAPEALARLIATTTESVRLLTIRLEKSAIPEDGWEYGATLAQKQQLLSLATELTTLRSQADALSGERDDLRARLFPYADDKQISGMSWDGFYLIGNDKSIKKLRQIENDAAQVEVYRKAFDERVAAEKARADAAEAQLARQGEGDHYKLDTDTQVFFYEQDFYVLSNFSAFNVKWHGRTFQTSEHAYHWSRFALGWDLTDAAGMDAAPVAVRVMAAPSAHEAFKLAQKYRDLQHPNWNMDKIDVMRSILFAKATQHEYVSRKLLATGDRELIEDSWRDDFWGWGPNRDGQNMLGKLWMEVRDELRARSALGDHNG